MIRRDTITEATAGRRLDEAVASAFELSKSEARRIIDRGGCAVNCSMVRVASRLVKAGDLLEVGIMEQGRFQELVLPPEALLYEDSDLIAVNKPAGINTQRTPYQLKGTLEYWVSEYFRQQGSNEPARVVHRLDRGTSGVMVFPKQRQAAAWLSKYFQDGLIEKRYLALVTGRPEQESWSVDAPIGKAGKARYGVMEPGRPALTLFRSQSSSGGYTLVEAKPVTGRTHQIRVHLEASGLSIVGDTTYGGESASRMMLHCAELGFKNQKKTDIVICAPLDAVFSRFMAEAGIIFPFCRDKEGTPHR